MSESEEEKKFGEFCPLCKQKLARIENSDTLICPNPNCIVKIIHIEVH
jgi:NAD-dependent DNA ligase